MKLTDKLKTLCLPAATAGLSAMTGLVAFAAEGDPVSATDWAPVFTPLTAQVSVSTIVGVLATLVTAGIGLVFMWWGVRKALSSLLAAFRKGRMNL